jgi:hypothetical protein
MSNDEIPLNFKSLYKHWSLHTSEGNGLIEENSVCKDKKLFDEITWFINERITIWKKKTRGEAPPFTSDDILSTYKFCNIFREFDRQTIEFHTMLSPLRGNLALWLLNMFYCRIVARPETILYTGLLSFDKNENKVLYEKLTDSPRPRYGTPYVFPVSVIQRGPTHTRELFIGKYLPGIMQAVAEEISSWNKLSVYDGVGKIIPIFRYELRFLWTEVLIDTAYQFPHLLDLFGRFPAGPGAAPTLTRIDPSRDPSLLVVDLSKLNIGTNLTYEGLPLKLSAENWEGIACEFRKYTNLKNGRGRHRLYNKEDSRKPKNTSLF